MMDFLGRVVEVGNHALGAMAHQMSGAQWQEAFNMAQAREQREYETAMSNTAYQRAAADMKAAGVNPATLSGLATGGSAASTPSGATATSATGQSMLPTIFKGLGNIITSVIGAVGKL